METDFAKNSPDETLLRKLRNSLVVSGSAVMAFAAWGVLRLILMLSFSGTAVSAEQEAETEEIIQAILKSEELQAFFLVFLIIVLIIVAIDFILRVYIGQSARSVGLGKKKKSAYLVLAFILAAFSVFFLIVELLYIPAMLQSESALSVIVSMAVEVTSLIFVLELLISGIREKKLSKKLGL